MTDRPITASMLYDYIQCPHRVTLDLFGNLAERDDVNPFIQLLWERGNAFEREVMAKVDVPFIDLRNGADNERQHLTTEAILAREPLIYGGRLAAKGFVGEPDLLRLVDNGYVPGDIKSGAGVEGASEDSDGKPKKHYAVQLGFYSDILKRLKLLGEGNPFIWDINGREIIYELNRPRGPKTPKTMMEEYYDTLKEVQDIVSRMLTTSPAMSSTCKLCHWYTVCSKFLISTDDLTLIPELGRDKRDKLKHHFTNVMALANADLTAFCTGPKSSIPGIGYDSLLRFQKRAQLQKQPNAQPYFISDLSLPPNELELFFDVETDPMRDNFCYLHGFIERRQSDPTKERYVFFLAEQPTIEAERNAFRQSWEYLMKSNPTAIYFYSHYEKTTLRHLATRYPEIATVQNVEDLFSTNYSVDLFQEVVRSKMVWPTHDHSIKTIALFLGFKWRDPEPSGAASVLWYHNWVDTGDDTIRQRILEYNEDDCIAMRVLINAIRQLLSHG